MSADTTPSLAFVDTETTHLDDRHGDAWEVAIIIRKLDSTETSFVWQIRPDLAEADPAALAIGRYAERFQIPKGHEAVLFLDTSLSRPIPITRDQVARSIAATLRGAVLVGSNPSFDARFLTKLLRGERVEPAWHYRTIDIATLAAGYRYGQAASGVYGGDFAFSSDYPQLPYKSYDLSRAVGVEPPTADVAHTALGDARWARDVYLALTGGDTSPALGLVTS